jgi:hypothetical protein
VVGLSERGPAGLVDEGPGGQVLRQKVMTDQRGRWRGSSADEMKNGSRWLVAADGRQDGDDVACLANSPQVVRGRPRVMRICRWIVAVMMGGRRRRKQRMFGWRR